MTLRIEFAHGKKFNQPPLHFLQIVVIAIENLLRLLEIEIVIAQFRPRQIGDGFDIANDDGIFRARRRDEIKPLQFAISLGQHIGGRLGFFQSLAQLCYLLVGAGVTFTQLLLDRF